MKSSFRLFIALLLFLVCGSSSYADTDEWTLLSTPNFEFYAQYDAQRARAKLEYFEVYRYAVYAMLGLDPNVKLAPMRIYAFSDSNDYSEIRGNMNAAGFYNSSGPYLVIGPEESSIEDNFVLFHEYLHYIVRASVPYQYPTWYDEGLATFFGVVEIDDDSITFGSRPEHYMRYLKYSGTLSFQKLIEQTNQSKSQDKTDNYQYKFYVSSWLATHYLIAGEFNGEKNYNPQLQQYLRLFNEGINSSQAFEQAFNIKPEEFNKTLIGYAKKRRNTAMRMARPKINLKVTESSVSDAEAALFYSQLTYKRIPEVNQKYFQIALQNKVSLALAYEANNAALQGDFSYSDAMLNEALSSDKKTWETHLHIAKTYITLAKKRNEQSLYTKAYAQLLIAENLKVTASVYRTLAEVAWSLGQRQKAIDYAIAQYQMEPSGVHANHVAGYYMVEAGKTEYGRFFLNNVINWTHSEPTKKRAQKLLDKINQLTIEAVDTKRDK
ncbi:hypothetical protein [Planctobacterium marinum]|uniref:DUF1570 domain-containing protein n=1 Tax=Planctobacterium marinum TaxID=1631968 RepID=A0AA48KV88_9ALTE|nr:hypothetical protein MACH26_27860 [Planctobacterium marinum]